MAGCNTFLVCTSLLLCVNKQLHAVLDNGDQQRSVSTGVTSPGPVCYSCEWLTDPTTCGHKITCGRDELCMLHELLPGIDGSRRYKASCEAEKVCESLRNHAKRAHIFCHNCCKEDLCNNRCGSTTTLPTTTPTTTSTTTPTTTTSTTTKAPTTSTTTTPTTTTPTMTTPTTTSTTTTPTTTSTTTTPTTTSTTTTPTSTRVTTPSLSPTTTHCYATFTLCSRRPRQSRPWRKRDEHRVTYPIMCFSCSMMVDPAACKHLVSCGVGHACMLQLTGRSISGKNLYKSSCEPDLLCNAISRFALIGKRGEDGYEPSMGVAGAGHIIQRRYSSCNKCCRKHLCNNHCDVPMTPTVAHTTVDDVSATTSYTMPHTTAQTTEQTTLHTTVYVHKTTSAPKTHSNVFSYTYVGCLPENQQGKFLTGQHWSSPVMTIKYCISFCKSLGFAYAGLEHGTECYCGNVYASLPAPVPEDLCSYRCSGDSDYICGGNMYISVYKTQRLCYNCDSFTHPDQCTNVTVCSDDQVCSIYQTEDHLLSGGKLYHAGCSTQKACDVFSNLPSIHDRYTNTDFCHTCCSSPLCNNVCKAQVTRAPTTLPTTTTLQSGGKCKQQGYVHIPYISLCFKLEQYTFSHNSAERWCEQFGATLAILDDPGKFSVLQTLLKVDPNYVNQIVYIGGENRYGNGTFYWPDGRHVTVGSWPGSTTSLCLSMDGTNGFGLRAVDCTAHLKFICTMDVS